MKKTALFAVASMATLLAGVQAQAADAAADGEAERTKTVEELVVTGEITFRNRTDEVAPTLS